MTDIERLTAERDFLLLRSSHAGKCMFGGERWTGISSNALVEVAFGGKNESLPSDGADLAACYRTMQRLPAHLLSGKLFRQVWRGEQAVAKWSKDDVRWAQEATGWDADALKARARDSGSGPKGENSRSEVECEASQSGGEAASPKCPDQTPPPRKSA